MLDTKIHTELSLNIELAMLVTVCLDLLTTPMFKGHIDEFGNI